MQYFILKKLLYKNIVFLFYFLFILDFIIIIFI